MKTRVITALVAIVALILLLIFKDTVAVCIALTLLGVIAAIEINKVSGNNNRVLFIASSLLLGVAPYFVRGYIPVSPIVLCAVYFIVFAVSLLNGFSHKNIERQFLVFGMTLYTAFGFGTVLKILDGKFGLFYFIVAAICAWITDTGAYFVGSLMGKHKLCPVLSPKKTVEGAVGGLLFCVLVAMAFAGLYTSAFEPTAHANYLPLVIVSLLASAGGMVGDLFASAVKRFYSVKDYGNFFPGHGGVLDRFDSVLISFPVVLIFSQYFPLIQ